MVKEAPKKLVEPIVVANEVSRIAENVSIKGDISSVTDLRIDGQVDGILYSKGRIVAGKSAVIKGNVLCNDLDLSGRIEGDIFTRGVLTLKDNSFVEGNIQARNMQIALGANINGSFKMISETEFDESVRRLVKLQLAGTGKVAEPVKA